MSLTFLLSMILGPSWRSDWWTVIPRSSSWILMRAQSSAPRLTGLVRYTSYGTAGLVTEVLLAELCHVLQRHVLLVEVVSVFPEVRLDGREEVCDLLSVHTAVVSSSLEISQLSEKSSSDYTVGHF